MTKEEFNKYLQQNYEELFNELFKYCFSMINDKEETEDIIQETFLKAMTYISSFHYGNIKAWLYSIAKRTYLYKIARKKIVNNISYKEQQQECIEKEMEDSIYSDLEKEKFISKMSNLTQQQQDLILYIDHMNLPYSKVAEIMKIPIGTIKSKLHYARKRLKDYIKDNEENNF